MDLKKPNVAIDWFVLTFTFCRIIIIIIIILIIIIMLIIIILIIIF